MQALAEMMEKKSKARWGNKIGYVLTRLPISLPDDPLDYIRQAKNIIDRKKLSLESRFSFTAAKLTQDIFGSKAVTIHFQSYCNKMTISMAVDSQVIQDPYQLCDDLRDSLRMFKEAVTKQDMV
uniref:O-acyltransferase WSD1 C-terminal domain-containing protein n=1 Tax=Solanum lycopersicum TaxID=4081 RepID=A0A3Q7GA91_SOLLC